MQPKNNFKCPQCGAASSTKVSETEYHCIYCDSSFQVELSKKELLEQMLSQNLGQNAEKRKELLEKLAAMKAANPNAGKKLGRIVGLSILIFVVGIGASVFFTVNSALKRSGVDMFSEWGTPSISKFAVFTGSKGTVAWFIQEYSRSGLDSAKYVLKIVDPQTKKTLKEFNYLPVMTWKESFNSSDFLGNFYQAGDTCWIASEQNGLTAKNIYSGEEIVNDQTLGRIFPKLFKGISKAVYSSGDNTFELTTNDGFDYIFDPAARTVLSKNESEKERYSKNVTRTFFILTDGNRPALFKTIERTSSSAVRSQVYSSDLENFTPGKVPERFGKNVLSLEQFLPDRAFFNGIIAYSDDSKAIILYQKGVGKKSGMIISCINADGKEVWSISGKELQDISDVFADSNHAIDIATSRSTVVLYFQRSNCIITGIDMNSGKIEWKYSSGDNP